MQRKTVDNTEPLNLPGELKNKNDRLIYFNIVTSEAIWEWDINSGEVFGNHSFEKLTGFAQKDTRDLSWWFNRIHIKDRNRVMNRVTTAIENKQGSWEEEYHIQSEEGIYKQVLDRGIILYEKETPVRVICSLKDLTEINELRNQLTQVKLEHQKEIAESVINAQEKERLNLGNELHDNVNQILVTTLLYLDMMKPTNSQEEELKDKIKEFIVMAFEEIRKLSKELVSPELRANSVNTGIQELVNDIEACGKFRIKYQHETSVWVSESLKITLYRIAQELLKNIIQYSNAQEITIDLRSGKNTIALRIADNGIGFDPQTIKRGIGLSNILEKVKLFNGEVVLDTSPGAGCRISITIPL